MHDGRFWDRSVKIFPNKDELKWDSASLRMCNAFCVDDKAILPPWAIKHSKTARIYTAILRLKATFADKMKSFLSYTQEFKENCGVRFVHVRLMDILEDLMSSNFSAANSWATYVCYIWAGKMTKKTLVGYLHLGIWESMLHQQTFLPSRTLMIPTSL